MRFQRFAVLAAAFSIGFSATPAVSSITIDLYKVDGSTDSDKDVVCSVFCEGWDAKSNTWGTEISGFDVAVSFGSESPTVKNIVDLFTATFPTPTPALTESGYTKLDGGSDYIQADVNEFLLGADANYFHVKDGNDLWFFRTFDSINTTVQQTISFIKSDGQGPSNIGSDGSISPVPLPAAGWLLLAGIAGLFGIRQKKMNTA